MTEQEIISKYFSRHQPADDLEIGVGDDAAVIIPPVDKKLVVTTDTLNEGVHFLSNCSAEHLGHKALAVNLSDIAAMGAKPLWATINLSLPNVEHEWLLAFSNGLFALADEHNVKIVGGDLVRGPLSISLQVIGYLTSGNVLTRSNADIGDDVYVSGSIGDAALGLKLIKKEIDLELSQGAFDYLYACHNRPIPRIQLGLEIVSFASATIDISDGFLQDLQRITIMSDVGARIDVEKIPTSSEMQLYREQSQDWTFPLTGGEDYELIFTANHEYREDINQLSKRVSCPITSVGKIIKGDGIKLYLENHEIALPQKLGYDHFP